MGEPSVFVRDCMTHRPVTLRPDSDPLAGVAICKSGKLRHLPVVDAEERVLGVVSRADLELFLSKSE
jgi:CBS-domain-containing membrane protein